MKMNPISGFIIISLSITLLYAIGLLIFITDYEENKCEMTYMFEYPQFVRISNKIDKKYPKYELYVYSEGRVTERARNMYFDGIPVLFIPGNAGSYRQVRSLASIALRKSFSSKPGYHFDYFVVNLNDEYSGLNGALLSDQLEYVNSSIQRIFELYRQIRYPPQSVILIGHSMGGVIARKVLSSLPSDSLLVPIAIALSAPLKRPPIVLDSYMTKFYEDIEQNQPVSTTFVSISGGFNDFLVPSGLANLRSENNTISTVTSNIPLSWINADHVSISWCKQTVMAIVKALFDCVDTRTKQISTNDEYRKSVFTHHLLHHSGTKIRQQNNYMANAAVSVNGKWEEILDRQKTIHFARGIEETHWFMVRLNPNLDFLTIVGINMDYVDWVYGCRVKNLKDDDKKCFDPIHLTHVSEISPSGRHKRRTLRLNIPTFLKENPDVTHVAFRALPTTKPVNFHIDMHSSKERTVTVNLPRWWSPSRSVVVYETAQNAVNYKLVLPDLQHIIQAYQLYVEPYSCTSDFHHATATLSVPWSNQEFHDYVTTADRTPFLLRLYGSKPNYASNQSAVVKLTLEPTCKYRVSIRSSIPGIFGQLARNYTPLLFTNIAVVVLMAFRAQLMNIGKTEKCSIFFTAITEGAKPYYVLTSVKLVSRICSIGMLTKYLPLPDWVILSEDGTDFFILPLLLYICSVGIVWILAIMYCISLTALESTVHKLTLKFLAKTVSFTALWSDHVMSVFQKLPFVVSGTLIFISLTTCGSLALCLGMVFYFLKLTQMSQDFVEEVVWYLVKKFAKKCKATLSKNKKKETKSESKVKNNNNHKEEKIKLKAIKNKMEIEPSTSKSSPSTSESVQSDAEKEKTEKTVEQINSDNNDVSDLEEKKSEKDNEKNEVQNDLENNKIECVNDNKKNQIKAAENKVENVDRDRPEELLTAYNAIFFHSSIFFIWCLLVIINVPAVLTWAHNYKYSKILQPDPSFIPGVVLSICSLPLWQLELPRSDRKWYKVLGHVILAVSILSLTYGTINLYRLNYFLSLVIALITAQQIIAPVKERSDVTDAPNGDSGDNDEKQKTSFEKYDDIKAKWE